MPLAGVQAPLVAVREYSKIAAVGAVNAESTFPDNVLNPSSARSAVAGQLVPAGRWQAVATVLRHKNVRASGAALSSSC